MLWFNFFQVSLSSSLHTARTSSPLLQTNTTKAASATADGSNSLARSPTRKAATNALAAKSAKPQLSKTNSAPVHSATHAPSNHVIATASDISETDAKAVAASASSWTQTNQTTNSSAHS